MPNELAHSDGRAEWRVPHTWGPLSAAFACVLFLYGCSRTAATQFVQYRPVSGIIGISTFLDVCKDTSNGAGMAQCNYQLAQLRSAGIARTRIDFSWPEIEPVQGAFDFTGDDNMVDAVLGSGMSVTAVLGSGNAWADARGSNSYPPDDPQTFADFAYRVAGHFKGRVERYEVWNEENTFRFWPPTADPKAYGALLEAASGAIKSADPDALVAFGGVFMWDVYGSITGGAEFLDQVLTLYPDMSRYMDAVAFHPYMDYPPSVAPDYSSQDQQSFDQMCDDIKAVLKKHGMSRPLWITEIGWPTYPPVDQSMQARWLARAYLEGIEQGIDSIDWYTFIDGSGACTPAQECYFGMFSYITAPSFYTPAQPKQSFYALKTLSSVLGDTSFDRDVSDQFGLEGARALYFTSKDGSKKVWVFFSQHGTPDQVVSIRAPSLAFYDISGTTFTPVYTDQAYSLTVTTSPVYAVEQQ